MPGLEAASDALFAALPPARSTCHLLRQVVRDDPSAWNETGDECKFGRWAWLKQTGVQQLHHQVAACNAGQAVHALTSLLACPAALSRSPADADRPGRKPWISEMYGYSFGASSSNVWHHVDFAAMLYPTYKPIGDRRGRACWGGVIRWCVCLLTAERRSGSS